MTEIYTTASGFRRAALRVLDADQEGLDELEDAWASLERPQSGGQPAPHAGAPSSYFAFGGEGPVPPPPAAAKSKKERKPIFISPPMTQASAPPVY